MQFGIQKLLHVSFSCGKLLNGDNQCRDLLAVKVVFEIDLHQFGANCQRLQSATDLNTFHYSPFNYANLTDPARNFGSLF